VRYPGTLGIERMTGDLAGECGRVTLMSMSELSRGSGGLEKREMLSVALSFRLRPGY
jgi:hypothetical protein